jgi:membrane protease YdiL (CAAX protease family)
VVPARPAASTVGANWLLLTRSGWALRWPALRAVGAPPLGLALVLVQAGGEEILLRGVLWGAVRTAGAVGMAICVTGAVVLLCRLPGFRFDLPTVTTIGFVSIVHNLMVSQGSALLPLALAQVTVLVLAGA